MTSRRSQPLHPLLLILLTLLLLPAEAWSQDRSANQETGETEELVYPLEPRLARTSLPGALRHDLLLPGPLVDIAFPRRADGSRRLVLLVADGPRSEDGAPRPRQLMEWIPGEPPRLNALATALPPQLDQLALLADPAGPGDLLLVGEDELLYLLEEPNPEKASADSTPVHRAHLVPVLTAEHARLDARPFPALDASPAAHLSLLDLGRLLRYRPGPGDLIPFGALDLPISAEPERGGLLLSSPRVTELARPGRSPLYLLGPELQGKRRLRVRILDPEGDTAESPETSTTGFSQGPQTGEEGENTESGTEAGAPTASLEEAWCLLPSAETPALSWFTLLGGLPHLVVTTFEADQLGIFDKHRVRLFPLVGDRTRRGRTATLAFQSASRRWQPLQPSIQDFDSDGNQDFLLLHAEGLSGSDTIAEIYYGKPDGSFRSSSRKVDLEAPAGPWALSSLTGPNLLGSRHPDLAAIAEGELHLYAGSAAKDRRQRPFPRRPTLEVPLADTPNDIEVEIFVAPDGSSSRLTLGATPFIHDLDGDGRGEVIVSESFRDGRGIVQVIQITEPGS
ncbi:MAG: hypothetical protein AAGD01_10200 [Acidobacteriota bacterium]